MGNTEKLLDLTYKYAQRHGCVWLVAADPRRAEQLRERLLSRLSILGQPSVYIAYGSRGAVGDQLAGTGVAAFYDLKWHDVYGPDRGPYEAAASVALYSDALGGGLTTPTFAPPDKKMLVVDPKVSSPASKEVSPGGKWIIMKATPGPNSNGKEYRGLGDYVRFSSRPEAEQVAARRAAKYCQEFVVLRISTILAPPAPPNQVAWRDKL